MCYFKNQLTSKCIMVTLVSDCVFLTWVMLNDRFYHKSHCNSWINRIVTGAWGIDIQETIKYVMNMSQGWLFLYVNCEENGNTTSVYSLLITWNLYDEGFVECRSSFVENFSNNNLAIILLMNMNHALKQFA